MPLAPFSTLGVGGPARHYVKVASCEALEEAASWAAERALPVLVLGGGSNLVLADEGFPGLVVHLALRGRTTEPAPDGRIDLAVAAGEPWDDLVAHAVEQGWAGLECLSGIPGLAGATPIQNVGAYGQDVSETVVHVAAYDRRERSWRRFTPAECAFGYRQSRFKGRDRDRFVVTEVVYRLQPGGAPAVRYPELARALEAAGTTAPTLAEVRDTVLRLRRRKSMVLDPADPDSRSVGSFFTNPILDADAFERLCAACDDPEGPPRFAAGEGRVKVPAAWLIERAGLARGHGAGAAGLSRSHVLAIVNRGGARARDVVAVAREVREAVRSRFGVVLEPEPVFVGVSLD